jgi:hypothetical protein
LNTRRIVLGPFARAESELVWAIPGIIGSAVRDKIDSALPPGLGFGDLVSSMLHDADNEYGLWVENDMGARWHASGDTHLVFDPKTGKASDDKTQIEMIGIALRAGRAELDIALQLGLEGRDLEPDGLGPLVRSRLAAPFLQSTNKYSAEQVMPRPSMDDADQREWLTDSLETLLPKFVRKDAGVTFLVALLTACRRGGEFYAKLANATPEDAPGFFQSLVHLNGSDAATSAIDVFAGLEPREAFKKGVLYPMETDPLQFMFSILAKAR